MNIKSIKLKNGEEIIADIEDDDDTITIDTPSVLLVNQQNGQAALVPWLQNSDDTTFTLNKSDILLTANVKPEIKDGYCQTFNKISVPTKTIIV